MKYILNGSIFHGDIRLEPGQKYLIPKYNVGNINPLIGNIPEHNLCISLTRILKHFSH